MMKKKTAVVLAAIILVFAFFSGFTEPAPPLWGYSSILQMENFGLLNVYSGMKSRPGDITEKEHLAVMIYTALEKGGKLKSSEDFSGAYSSVLTKYKINSGAKKSVAYGLKYGLWSESDFAGPTALTREMAAKWLVSAAGVGERVMNVLDCRDVSAADAVYYRYIDDALKAGLMQQGPDGGFHPELYMVRMEAAGLSVGLYSFQPPAVGTKKTDISVVYGKTSGFNTSSGTFLMETENGFCGIRISGKAKILIDGKAGSFRSITALSGKSITVACVTGENQTVLVQTKPSVQSGVVVSSKKKTDYTLLMIDVDGTKAPYCITENTVGAKSFSAGDAIRFIPDGCEIIEAAK